MIMLSALLLTGCVPKKQYLELENQLAAVRTTHAGELAERDATIGALSAEIDGLKANISELEGEATKAEDEIYNLDQLRKDFEDRWWDYDESLNQSKKDFERTKGELHETIGLLKECKRC